MNTQNTKTTMSPRELEEKYKLPARTVNTWVRDGKLTAATHGAGKALRYEVREADFRRFILTLEAGKHRKTQAELLHLVRANYDNPQRMRSEATPQKTPALPNTQSDIRSDSQDEPSDVTEPKQQPMKSAPAPSNQSEPIVLDVGLKQIQCDADCQIRAKQDQNVIKEYAEAMKAGAQFPPVELFEDQKAGLFYIGDGYHRIGAHYELGLPSVSAKVHQGGKAAAIRHALQANHDHGLRRTSADKRRAIRIATQAYPKLSNVEIAKICGVSESSVRNHREKIDSEQKRIGGDGKTQAAHKRTPSPYRRAKSAITKVKCTKEDAAKLIDWLKTHYHLGISPEAEAPKQTA